MKVSKMEIKKGLYQHYKGGLYTVIDVAKHSETLEDMIVYRSEHFGTLWVRPASMFFEEVEKDGQKCLRFRPVVDNCKCGITDCRCE
jgi:hypothetical protein